ncbi:MAG: tetratricopeptide repeat protein [Bacteroidetes bacterium]|nr:MAG: tetratricopeptide repeat protein [Bacteroidota bacterium]TAG94838.1 MAG: tetratricopeptide repeat protein [Bacteroidota bacterium]
MKLYHIVTTIAVSTAFTLQLYAQNPESAKIELDAKKVDVAKETIEKVIANPKHALKSKAWYYRGLIYKAIADDRTETFIKLDPNPIEKAQESFKKAMELEPLKKGFYKEAAKDLEDLYDPAMNFAISCYQRKDFMGAMKGFWAAHNIKPSEMQPLAYATQFAFENKDDVMYEQGLTRLTNTPMSKYDEFNKVQTKEESKFKKSSFWQQLAFFTRDTKKDAKKTEEICKAALKDYPEDKTIQSILLEMYGKSGNYDAALEAAEKQTKTNPKDLKAWQNLGIVYEKLGKEDKALETYKKCVELDPNNADANYSLGAFHFNKGAVIMKVVNDMDMPTYNKKGKAEEIKAGVFFKEAMPYFEKINSIKPNDMKTLGVLSQIYNALGMKDKKEKVSQQMKDLDKDK